MLGGRVKQVVIENPILNSPFEEPSRHFLFSEEGTTSQETSKRRMRSCVVSSDAKREMDECGRCAVAEYSAEIGSDATLHE